MLKRVVQSIASRGTPYGWQLIKGFKHVKCIGYSGWMYEQFMNKDVENLKEILRKTYTSERMSNIILGKGESLPAEMFILVVSPEGAFCGVDVKPSGSVEGTEQGSIKFPGSNVLPHAWIPDIVQVLQETCKYYESLSPSGRKYMFGVTSTFAHHNTDGTHETAEHDGKVFKLASNIAITATSDTFLLVNKWEQDPTDNMGEYKLKSDWERLTGPIKKEMEAKVHVLSGETEGLRGVVSLICRDFTQLHTLRLDGLKPDAVLFYCPANGGPPLEGFKTPTNSRIAFFMCDGNERALRNTGVYVSVPDEKEWCSLKDDAKLARSRDLPNILTAAWNWFSGQGTQFIDRGEGKGGIAKHVVPTKLGGSAHSWVAVSEVFKISEDPPKETEYLVQAGKYEGDKGGDKTHSTLPESDPDKTGYKPEVGKPEVPFGEHPRLEDPPHKEGRK